MRRILIIGCSGSGKSTFSKKLSSKLNIPLYHLDAIWWYGNWEHITKAELKDRLKEIMKEDKWIIDGNYKATLEYRMKYADTLIYLDFNVIYCLFNALKRYFKNKGKVRDDMGGNCREKIDFEFVWFILTYNIKHRKKIYKTIREFKGEVHIFKSRKKLNKWLKDM